MLARWLPRSPALSVLNCLGIFQFQFARTVTQSVSHAAGMAWSTAQCAGAAQCKLICKMCITDEIFAHMGIFDYLHWVVGTRGLEMCLC